jgi:hypothetical protein
LRIKVFFGGNISKEPYRMDVSPDELVENVKKVILFELPIELPGIYRLTCEDCEGRELEDGTMMSSYGIHERVPFKKN